MFADAAANLRYVWRAIGKIVRHQDPLKVSEVSGLPVSVIEELSLYGVQLEWEGQDCPVDLTVAQLAGLARTLGLGLRVELADSNALDEWVADVSAETLLPTVVRHQECVVCRHPNVIEIEMLIAKGMAITRMASAFRISATTLNRHRSMCMAGRIDRIQQAFGAVADITALQGTVNVVDGVMDIGRRAAEAALAAGQLSDTNTFLGTLLQGTEIRGKLTGELGERAENGGEPAAAPKGNMNVIVVPTLDAGRRMLDIQGEST